MRLLIAEDEKELSKALCILLKKNGYSPDPVYNGQDALDYILSGTYDCVLLDIMMPKLNGIEVLTEVRSKGIDVPIIMLTAKDEIEDRVDGLDHGADDYVPKPFSTKELIARIRAVTRRKLQGSVNNLIEFGPLVLNLSTHSITGKKGTAVPGNIEFQILEKLISTQNTYVSGEQIFETVWGLDSNAETSIVWVHISNLRRVLEKVDSGIQITAKRNIGYRLEVLNC